MKTDDKILKLERTAVEDYEKGLKNAVLKFQHILELDPENITSHFYLALIYLSREEYDKALEHAKIVKKQNRIEPNIHLNIGAIYESMGDITKAIKFYKKELLVNAKCAEALYNLAHIFYDRGRWKTAIKYFEQLYPLDYKADDVDEHLIYCYHVTKQLDKEIMTLRRYLKRDPTSAWGVQNLGAALIDQGEYQESLVYLKKAAKLLPQDESIRRNMRIVSQAMLR